MVTEGDSERPSGPKTSPRISPRTRAPQIAGIMQLIKFRITVSSLVSPFTIAFRDQKTTLFSRRLPAGAATATRSRPHRRRQQDEIARTRWQQWRCRVSCYSRPRLSTRATATKQNRSSAAPARRGAHAGSVSKPGPPKHCNRKSRQPARGTSGPEPPTSARTNSRGGE